MRDDLPEYGTRRQVARHFGIGERQIDRFVRDGDLTPCIVGSWPRYRYAEVRSAIENRRAPRAAVHGTPTEGSA